nr:hypothetical protein [Tanacetum cinerariifolium]
MTGIDYTSPSGDELCGGHRFDVMPLGDSNVPAPVIHHVSVSRVDERGCVHTSPLITASLEEIPCSRAICTHGVAGYVGSSSTIAPFNHAYLCLNVTDGVVRPEIIPFTNIRLGSTYEGHGRRQNTHHTRGLFQHNE